MLLTRRSLLVSASVLSLAGPALAKVAKSPAQTLVRARPVPLSDVRLKPSIWADAVAANHAYLLSLSSDRLLHNFRKFAGLQPRAPRYGGWEDQAIAGHTLGHYMSALALMYAQTGDEQLRQRLRAIAGDLAEVQRARGDGYIGGTTVERDGKELDGKIVFEEIRGGKIETQPWAVNGAWVPLYTWHKVQAGLVDAIHLAAVSEARPVLTGMADYLGGVFDALSDAQVQKLLEAEHGGLNEAYADTFALTGNSRYLMLAERIRHRAVLDPLADGRDVLPGLHANTQVPKLIGLARLYELTGEERQARAARFFFDAVTRHHSYVIGGNSDFEHFGAPDSVAAHLSDRTCEHCNSYNMLKLARHLYGWSGDPSLFDYYERTHLNHVMAAQHPNTGLFVYYMPLASGAKRTYSMREAPFWCCVGTGMESHSKHGDSIYWEDGRTLFVNLFIPSQLDWLERGLKLDLDTQFPFSDRVALTVAKAPRTGLPIALRLPGWAQGPNVRVNGEPAHFERRNGYALLTRRWRTGDRIELQLPMTTKVEPTPDDPRMVAFSHGPLVLAADLDGPTAAFTGPVPGILASDPASALQPVDPGRHLFRITDAAPGALTLKPFFNLYDRRTAVYFPLYTEAEWDMVRRNHEAAAAEQAAVDRRTIDLVQPGEFDQEAAHSMATTRSEYWQLGGRGMRDGGWGPGNFTEFTMAVRPGPTAVRALYWGEDVDKDFFITVDGKPLVHVQRKGPPVKQFVAAEYPLPPAIVAGKNKVRVRFEAGTTNAPLFELRTVESASA